MNIFERAVRGKYRFPSKKGELTAEDLFDLPLTSNNGFNLDEVAKSIDDQLETSGRRSFVAPTSTDEAQVRLKGMLECVLLVIQAKQAQKERAENAAAKAEKRRVILEAIENRQNEDLKGKSIEELTAELAALDT